MHNHQVQPTLQQYAQMAVRIYYDAHDEIWQQAAQFERPVLQIIAEHVERVGGCGFRYGYSVDEFDTAYPGIPYLQDVEPRPDEIRCIGEITVMDQGEKCFVPVTALLVGPYPCEFCGAEMCDGWCESRAEREVAIHE